MNREQQAVVLFLVFSLGFLYFLRPTPSNLHERFQEARAGKGMEKKTLPPEQLMIEVDGMVNRRGVFPLEAGVTIREALEKAGAIPENIHLAPEPLRKKLATSSRLHIQPEGEGKGRVLIEPLAPSKMKILFLPISINSASTEELDTLPGIGSKTAQAIVEFRETRGKFTTPEDLLQVPGISPKKLAALKPHIRIR